MQNIIKNKLLSSIVFLILGVLLLIAPTQSLELFVRIIGGVFLLGALVRLVAYFVTKKEDRVPLSLVLGVAAAAIGLFFVLLPGVVTNILAYVFGAILILNSLLDLVIAVRLPAGKLVAILLALLGLALGVLIVVNPQAFASFMTRFIGATLIYESIVGIVTSILARKTVKSALLDK
jgi:uncharacterized membrane protein HdeD (DUF308 family)